MINISRKKTLQEFIGEVYELSRDEYTVVGDYQRNRVPTLMRHNVCGNEYLVRPSSFLRGDRCPKCKTEQRARMQVLTKEEFESKFYANASRDEYQLQSDYKGAREKITVWHKKCGNIYDVKAANFVNSGQRCPKCNRNYRKRHDVFLEEVVALVGDEYTFLQRYKNATTKILVKHNSCDYMYEVRPADFLHSGMRCPKCKESKGEREVSEALEELGISYAKQYKFNDCRNKLPLPFDFAVLKEGVVVCLIEFDGRQHFEDIEFFGGSQGFEYRVQNDAIKETYCRRNNIKLVRVPYWKRGKVKSYLSESLMEVV